MQVTRREFLLQTGQACLGYALGAAAFAAGVAALQPDQRAGAGVRLQGAGLRVPGRRQRRQQHGRPARARPSTTPTRRCAAPRAWRSRATACCRSRRRASAARSACIRAWRSCRRCGPTRSSSVVCNVGPLVQPLTRERVPERRAAARISCSRTPIRSRSGRRRSPIASARPAGAAAPPIASRRTASGLPDDHRAVRRHLHARPDHDAAVDRRGADGAQPGAGAERLRHRRRRSRAPARSMEFLRTIDTEHALVGAASRTTQQALDIGQTLNSDVDAGDGVSRTPRSATS